MIEKITAEEQDTQDPHRGGRVRPDVLGAEVGVRAVGAVATASLQEQLYLAHRAAVAETCDLVEAEALFTRMGAHGVTPGPHRRDDRRRVRPLGFPQGRPTTAHPRHGRQPRPGTGRRSGAPWTPRPCTRPPSPTPRPTTRCSPTRSPAAPA